MEHARPEFKTEAERLYYEQMGPEAFRRQREAQARRCTCGNEASPMKPWAHKPGCRLKEKR